MDTQSIHSDGQDPAALESTGRSADVSPTRFLPERGRSNSPPWLKSRCFVYDRDNSKLEVQKKEAVKGSLYSFVTSSELTILFPGHERDFQKIQLKPWQRHITLFVSPDAETEDGKTELKTSEQTKGDGNRLLFATLDLRGPGLVDKIHMMAGGLKTLYVSNKCQVRREFNDEVT